MTVEVSREAAQAILLGSETRIDEHSLIIAVGFEFNGKSPTVPAGGRHIRADGTLFPVQMFPFVWDLAAASSRLVRGRSSEEEVKLHPTFYSLVLRREGGTASAALVSWEKAERRRIAETQLDVLDLAGTFWGLANSVLASALNRNPTLRGNLLIQRFSDTVQELSDSLLRSGWHGPF